MNWWTNLVFFEQILLTITFASYVFICVKIVLDIISFYKIDKLSLEREELDNFDEIANNDSDVEKNAIKFFSMTSVNILLASLGTFYFIFNLFLTGFWHYLATFIVSVLVFVCFSIFKIKLGKR